MVKKVDPRIYDASDYGTINQSRNAAIVGAANLLEAADKAKRLRKRFTSTLDLPDADREEADGRSDFLLDLMRLNANYMNQLASLGKRHGDIANSALEKLYRILVPPARRDASAQLRFDKSTTARHFIVRNDCSRDPEVHIEQAGFVPSTTRADGLWLRTVHEVGRRSSGDYEKTYTFDVPFGGTKEFVAEVGRGFLARRLYAVELIVRMGQTRKTIPVLIDLRESVDSARTSE